MAPRRLSLLIYRTLLRVYPRDFRERFGADLESDFLQIAAARGVRAAWSRTLADLFRAIPLTHRDARADRRRRDRIGGPFHLRNRTMNLPNLLFDVRHALRGLIRAPVFTAVVIATLALGIGANSAIFSLVNTVLLRPLGYHDPDRLASIYEVIPESKVPRFGVSPADYLDLVQYQQSFGAIGAYRVRLFELSGAGEPDQITGAQVTASLFPLLGVEAATGRTFVPEEEQPGPSVVVISDGLWRRRFGSRPVVGERVMLDRRPYTIVGVMPASFQFPKRNPQINGEPADVWMPLVFTPFERQARGMFYTHSVIGRLRVGVSMQQAIADTGALAPRIRENYPVTIRNAFTLGVVGVPLVDEIAGQVRRPLLILLGAVGLVLLVACANVANLILSRAVARRREIGVRVALGAGRHRLFQMLLFESLILALSGGALGLIVGHWAVRAMPAVIAASLPGVADVALDMRVAAFTLVISVITALMFGIAPLVAAPRRDVADALREGVGRTTGGRRQHRVQSTLVVASVAFAFVLLVSAGLLLRSFRHLIAIDPGLRATNVLSMEVTLPFAGYNNAARVRGFYRNVEQRLRSLPGVNAAALSTDLPLKPDGERRAFTPEQSPVEGVPPSVAVTWVHGDYFATYGVPLVRGRKFSAEEHNENRLVTIVSRTLAERYWPGQDPIGKRIKWGLPISTAPWQTVVGVAGDVVDGALGTEPVIHAYVPYSEVSDQILAAPMIGLVRRMVVGINTNLDAASLTTSARAAIAAEDPVLAIARVETLEKVLSDASAPQRFSAMVLAAFAGGALLLAAIGLYGVLAFAVSQRTREIGVRLALGARRREVLGLIVREGMVLTGIGLAIGGTGAVATVRLLRALLFETEVYDAWTFATVPLLLAAVALAACFVPASRASRVDPMVALRTE